MNGTNDPFRAADDLLAGIKAKVILVDFHAEATSEKVAMGWHLDGPRDSGSGTHTHIPTADERVLPGGTAYQTDVGMSGPYDSVIGSKRAGVAPVSDWHAGKVRGRQGKPQDVRRPRRLRPGDWSSREHFAGHARGVNPRGLKLFL